MTYDYAALSPVKRHWLTKTSNIPRRFYGWEPQDIIDDKGSFPEAIDNWVADVTGGHIIMNPGALGMTGKGLLFDGKPGKGKTTHAVVTLMEIIRKLPEDPEACRKLLYMSAEDFGMRSRPVYYLTMTDLLYLKKSAFEADGETRKRLQAEMEGFHGRSTDDRMNVRVLVLDDLGKEYGSKYDGFSFDEILRSRYDRGLPTIITTNTDISDWRSRYSEAMESFAHEAFRRVQLGGVDLRKR